MHIVSTHHIALYTPNYPEMRRFYTETLGLPVVGGFQGHNIIFLAAGSTTIELEETSDGAHGTVGWAHLAFEVDDVAAACADLAARGVTFHIPPQDFPARAPAVRSAFFKDPDGNELELLQPLGSRYPAPT